MRSDEKLATVKAGETWKGDKRKTMAGRERERKRWARVIMCQMPTHPAGEHSSDSETVPSAAGHRTCATQVPGPN